MAGNFVQEGCVIELAAPTGGVVGGTAILVGSLVLIPMVTAAQTVRTTFARAGVFTVAKATGVAWTEGQILYFDSAAGNFATAASATARRAGFATLAAASGDTTGTVLLNNIGAAVNVA